MLAVEDCSRHAHRYQQLATAGGIAYNETLVVRPFLDQRLVSLSQAEEENGQSRIYLGIHWHFDKTEGIAQGPLVGDWVFDHAFAPRGRSSHGSR